VTSGTVPNEKLVAVTVVFEVIPARVSVNVASLRVYGLKLSTPLPLLREKLPAFGTIIWDGWPPPMASSSTMVPFPEMLPLVMNRVGDPEVVVTAPELLMLICWPEAVPVRVVEVVALLRVKRKSLSAWPWVVKVPVSDKTTVAVPVPVVTVAFAVRVGVMFAEKDWMAALAGFGPQARTTSAMTQLRRVKLSFMRCVSLR
jgi:hypothetical protein